MKKINLLSVILVVVTCATMNATSYTINVEDNEFDPAYLQVMVGDSITWVHDNSAGDHTTTSIDIPGDAMPWNQDITASNPTFTYVVTQPGTYNYHCTIHVDMTASFEAGSAPEAIASTGPIDISLTVTPNPVSNSMCINYDLPDNTSHAQIQVLNLNGDVMYERNTEMNLYSDCVETDGYASGIYIVKISGDYFIVAKNFIVE